VAIQRVAVIGLGLIGCSLGLALRRQPRPPRVMGYDRSTEARREATRRQAIDRSAASPVDAVDEAELVILATPVRAIAPLLAEIAPHLSSGCVVTDTGSTKAEVVAACAAAAPEVAFVGGHPMAGKLSRGTEEADAALFQGAVYCLTPSAHTAPAAVSRVVELVEAVGARPYFLEPAEHDGLVAAISHLPYLLASTLMSSVSAEASWREMATLAAGGFATMTRLVDSEPEMYADICLTNRAALLYQLDRYAAELAALREAVAQGDEALRERFDHARERHQAWLRHREAAPSDMPPLDELKGPNLFLPQSWQDALRGKRPDKNDKQN
jgi:prephenate dehydrogenase